MSNLATPTYARLLKSLREAHGTSQRALARGLDLNPALVNRSEDGTRPPRDPAEVMRVGDLLELTERQRDELLAAAGFWPAAYHRLGPDDPTLSAVAGSLADPTLADDVRAALRDQIERLVALCQRINRGAPGTP